MQKAKDLRNQSLEELSLLMEDIDKDLYNLRNELKGTKKLDKPHKLKELKKDKAKILTVLTEKRTNG